MAGASSPPGCSPSGPSPARVRTDLLQRGAAGPQPIRHHRVRLPVPAHSFPEEFRGRLLVPRLRHEAFQHLTFVVDDPPEMVPLAIDLHKRLIAVPSPTTGLHAFDAALADLGGERRTEAMPPEAHGLVADLDATLVQQVLDMPQRNRDPATKSVRSSRRQAKMAIHSVVQFPEANSASAPRSPVDGTRPRNSRISAAISPACVSNAKCPASRRCTSASGRSRL